MKEKNYIYNIDENINDTLRINQQIPQQIY